MYLQSCENLELNCNKSSFEDEEIKLLENCIFLLITKFYFCASSSVKAMLLIIDCKKKITWKKLDHINGSVLSSDGKIASEEKELLKVAENGEVDKVMDEVVDELLVSINKLAMITCSELSAF